LLFHDYLSTIGLKFLVAARRPIQAQQMVRRVLASRGNNATHYSVSEAREAIVQLTPGEKTKLLTVAKVYARRNQSKYDYEELFSEAATRILEDKRPWPRNQIS